MTIEIYACQNKEERKIDRKFSKFNTPFYLKVNLHS